MTWIEDTARAMADVVRHIDALVVALVGPSIHDRRIARRTARTTGRRFRRVRHRGRWRYVPF